MHPFHYCDVTVYGFHGCHSETKKQILSGKTKFHPSENRYDWLGFSIYFWESDFLRAQNWAAEMHGVNSAVIGAKIKLGNCFDLSNSFAKQLRQMSYSYLHLEWQKLNAPVPTNSPHPQGKGSRTTLRSFLTGLHEHFSKRNSKNLY